jgi:hypothetical protein
MKTRIAGLAALALAVGLLAGAAVVATVNGQSPENAAVEMSAACTEHMASMTAMHDVMGGSGMMGGPGMMGSPDMMGGPDMMGTQEVPGGIGPGHESHHASPTPDPGPGQ